VTCSRPHTARDPRLGYHDACCLLWYQITAPLTRVCRHKVSSIHQTSAETRRGRPAQTGSDQNACRSTLDDLHNPQPVHQSRSHLIRAETGECVRCRKATTTTPINTTNPTIDMAEHLEGVVAGSRKQSILFSDDTKRKASVAQLTSNASGE